MERDERASLGVPNVTMKEATREHQLLEQTFALVPPHPTPRERLRLRQGINASPTITFGDNNSRSTTLSLPSVLVESAENRRHKNSRGRVRRYLRPVLWILGALFAVDLIHDHFFFAGTSTMMPPIIQRDYSHVTSVNDIVETVDSVQGSRCFHKQPMCKCSDTTIPSGRQENPQWSMVHHLNKEASQRRENDIDVLFLGDSITEGWLGTSYGRKHAVVHSVPQVFQSLFSAQNDGLYEGLALGISGDTAPNLLWRIQNGEVPPKLHPSVIWVLIGTNDFGSTWCSAEMVLIGILRVVEELRTLKPDSVVVINGLLPRTYNRQGYVGRGRSRRTWRLGKNKSLPAMPSLWDDLEAVNEELKNYAASRAGVEYFETRAFWVDPNVPDDDMLQINGKLMPDFFHPSAEGYRLWGQEIVEKLKVLIPSR